MPEEAIVKADIEHLGSLPFRIQVTKVRDSESLPCTGISTVYGIEIIIARAILESPVVGTDVRVTSGSVPGTDFKVAQPVSAPFHEILIGNTPSY